MRMRDVVDSDEEQDLRVTLYIPRVSWVVGHQGAGATKWYLKQLLAFYCPTSDRDSWLGFAPEFEFFRSLIWADAPLCLSLPLSSLGMRKIILTTCNGLLQPCISLLSHRSCAFYLFIAGPLAWSVLTFQVNTQALSLLAFSHTHFCTKVPEALVIY